MPVTVMYKHNRSVHKRDCKVKYDGAELKAALTVSAVRHDVQTQAGRMTHYLINGAVTRSAKCVEGVRENIKRCGG